MLVSGLATCELVLVQCGYCNPTARNRLLDTVPHYRDSPGSDESGPVYGQFATAAKKSLGRSAGHGTLGASRILGSKGFPQKMTLFKHLEEDYPISITLPDQIPTNIHQERWTCPRARAGRDVSVSFVKPNLRVSIHAPARGATEPFAEALPFQLFQSTRPRGARLAQCDPGGLGRCFNPRARAGRDRRLDGRVLYARSFNPRARAGRDLSLAQTQLGFRSFNPRARAGRDLPFHAILYYTQVSIHAPARGATVSL